MWIILALISAISAALVTIFAKIGLKNIDSIFATTIRTFIMAIILVSTTFVLKKNSFVGFNRTHLIYIILSAIFGAISWITYFLALKSGPASRVAAIDRSSLIFIAIMSALFIGESLTLKSIIGFLTIIVGIFLVI